MAVNRRFRGCKCQSDDSEIALKTSSNGSQSPVNRRLRGCKCQSDDSEIALKTPSNGSQSAVNRRLGAGNCQSDDSEIALKTSSNGRQSAVKWQSNVSQSALTGLQMSVRRQRNHTRVAESSSLHSYGGTKELARTTVHRNGATSDAYGRDDLLIWLGGRFSRQQLDSVLRQRIG